MKISCEGEIWCWFLRVLGNFFVWEFEVYEFCRFYILELFVILELRIMMYNVCMFLIIV